MKKQLLMTFLFIAHNNVHSTAHNNGWGDHRIAFEANYYKDMKSKYKKYCDDPICNIQNLQRSEILAASTMLGMEDLTPEQTSASLNPTPEQTKDTWGLVLEETLFHKKTVSATLIPRRSRGKGILLHSSKRDPVRSAMGLLLTLENVIGEKNPKAIFCKYPNSNSNIDTTTIEGLVALLNALEILKERKDKGQLDSIVNGWKELWVERHICIINHSHMSKENKSVFIYCDNIQNPKGYRLYFQIGIDTKYKLDSLHIIDDYKTNQICACRNFLDQYAFRVGFTTRGVLTNFTGNEIRLPVEDKSVGLLINSKFLNCPTKDANCIIETMLTSQRFIEETSHKCTPIMIYEEQTSNLYPLARENCQKLFPKLDLANCLYEQLDRQFALADNFKLHSCVCHKNNTNYIKELPRSKLKHPNKYFSWAANSSNEALPVNDSSRVPLPVQVNNSSSVALLVPVNNDKPTKKPKNYTCSEAFSAKNYNLAIELSSPSLPKKSDDYIFTEAYMKLIDNDQKAYGLICGEIEVSEVLKIIGHIYKNIYGMGYVVCSFIRTTRNTLCSVADLYQDFKYPFYKKLPFYIDVLEGYPPKKVSEELYNIFKESFESYMSGNLKEVKVSDINFLKKWLPKNPQIHTREYSRKERKEEEEGNILLERIVRRGKLPKVFIIKLVGYLANNPKMDLKEITNDLEKGYRESVMVKGLIDENAPMAFQEFLYYELINSIDCIYNLRDSISGRFKGKTFSDSNMRAYSKKGSRVEKFLMNIRGIQVYCKKVRQSIQWYLCSKMLVPLKEDEDYNEKNAMAKIGDKLNSWNIYDSSGGIFESLLEADTPIDKKQYLYMSVKNCFDDAFKQKSKAVALNTNDFNNVYGGTRGLSLCESDDENGDNSHSSVCESNVHSFDSNHNRSCDNYEIIKPYIRGEYLEIEPLDSSEQEKFKDFFQGISHISKKLKEVLTYYAIDQEFALDDIKVFFNGDVTDNEFIDNILVESTPFEVKEALHKALQPKTVSLKEYLEEYIVAKIEHRINSIKGFSVNNEPYVCANKKEELNSRKAIASFKIKKQKWEKDQIRARHAFLEKYKMKYNLYNDLSPFLSKEEITFFIEQLVNDGFDLAGKKYFAGTDTGMSFETDARVFFSKMFKGISMQVDKLYFKIKCFEEFRHSTKEIIQVLRKAIESTNTAIDNEKSQYYASLDQSDEDSDQSDEDSGHSAYIPMRNTCNYFWTANHFLRSVFSKDYTFIQGYIRETSRKCMGFKCGDVYPDIQNLIISFCSPNFTKKCTYPLFNEKCRSLYYILGLPSGKHAFSDDYYSEMYKCLDDYNVFIELIEYIFNNNFHYYDYNRKAFFPIMQGLLYYQLETENYWIRREIYRCIIFLTYLSEYKVLYGKGKTCFETINDSRLKVFEFYKNFKVDNEGRNEELKKQNKKALNITEFEVSQRQELLGKLYEQNPNKKKYPTILVIQKDIEMFQKKIIKIICEGVHNMKTHNRLKKILEVTFNSSPLYDFKKEIEDFEAIKSEIADADADADSKKVRHKDYMNFSFESHKGDEYIRLALFDEEPLKTRWQTHRESRKCKVHFIDNPHRYPSNHERQVALNTMIGRLNNKINSKYNKIMQERLRRVEISKIKYPALDKEERAHDKRKDWATFKSYYYNFTVNDSNIGYD